MAISAHTFYHSLLTHPLPWLLLAPLLFPFFMICLPLFIFFFLPTTFFFLLPLFLLYRVTNWSLQRISTFHKYLFDEDPRSCTKPQSSRHDLVGGHDPDEHDIAKAQKAQAMLAGPGKVLEPLLLVHPIGSDVIERYKVVSIDHDNEEEGEVKYEAISKPSPLDEVQGGGEREEEEEEEEKDHEAISKPSPLDEVEGGGEREEAEEEEEEEEKDHEFSMKNLQGDQPMRSELIVMQQPTVTTMEEGMYVPLDLSMHLVGKVVEEEEKGIDVTKNHAWHNEGHDIDAFFAETETLDIDKKDKKILVNGVVNKKQDEDESIGGKDDDDDDDDDNKIKDVEGQYDNKKEVDEGEDIEGKEDDNKIKDDAKKIKEDAGKDDANKIKEDAGKDDANKIKDGEGKDDAKNIKEDEGNLDDDHKIKEDEGKDDDHKIKEDEGKDDDNKIKDDEGKDDDNKIKEDEDHYKVDIEDDDNIEVEVNGFDHVDVQGERDEQKPVLGIGVKKEEYEQQSPNQYWRGSDQTEEEVAGNSDIPSPPIQGEGFVLESPTHIANIGEGGISDGPARCERVEQDVQVCAYNMETDSIQTEQLPDSGNGRDESPYITNDEEDEDKSSVPSIHEGFKEESVEGKALGAEGPNDQYHPTNSHHDDSEVGLNGHIESSQLCPQEQAPPFLATSGDEIKTCVTNGYNSTSSPEDQTHFMGGNDASQIDESNGHRELTPSIEQFVDVEEAKAYVMNGCESVPACAEEISNGKSMDILGDGRKSTESVHQQASDGYELPKKHSDGHGSMDQKGAHILSNGLDDDEMMCVANLHALALPHKEAFMSSDVNIPLKGVIVNESDQHVEEPHKDSKEKLEQAPLLKFGFDGTEHVDEPCEAIDGKDEGSDLRLNLEDSSINSYLQVGPSHVEVVDESDVKQEVEAPQENAEIQATSLTHQQEEQGIKDDIKAIRKIVGCNGDPNAHVLDQLRDLYAFLGMEPLSWVSAEVEDLEKARGELDVLKVVVGVK